MKIKLTGIDSRIKSLIYKIGKEADLLDFKVYIVGGFVRDLILGRKNLDLDVVVEGDAIALAAHIAKKEKISFVKYEKFGTATLEYSKGLHVDLAMARKEVYAFSGALPTVRPGDIQDDLSRRDFTVNAMAVSINTRSLGELIDKYNGYSDIRNGKIKILHKESFVDDPTRIIRAVRFEQRFGFNIERQTLALLKKALKKNVVRNVKPPRYFDAFKKLLNEKCARKCIARLHRLNGLSFFYKNFKPDFYLLSFIDRNIKSIKGDSVYKDASLYLFYLICLVNKFKVKDIEDISARFQLTRKEKNILVASKESQKVIRCLNKKKLKSSEVYQILNALPDEIICFIRIRTSVNIVGRYIDCFCNKYQHVKLEITGNDIKKLGAYSGKIIGDVLNDVLMKKIDGKLKTKKEELDEVKQILGLAPN